MVHPTLELLEADVADVCRRFQVRELALFGSAVRGDFHSGSDVDFLVEFEAHARTGFRFCALQRELEALVSRRVDLVSKRALNPLIRDEILASRQVIYAS
jgi:predicted nucleotidyltransferase